GTRGQSPPKTRRKNPADSGALRSDREPARLVRRHPQPARGMHLARERPRRGVLRLAMRLVDWFAVELHARLTSPPRGEVGSRRLPAEGITISRLKQRPGPPHPIPLPCGERETHAARLSRISGP